MMAGELYPIVNAGAKPLGEAVGTTLADAWQGIFGDKVTAWRIRNAAGLNEKLRIHLEAKGTILRSDALPEGIAFRWFEKATQEDQPEIQELFAQLLANAATGNEDALRKRNIDLISDLSPDDARLLSLIADSFAKFQETNHLSRPFVMTWDATFLEPYFMDWGFKDLLPIDNLLSLGILRRERDFKADEDTLAQAIYGISKEQARGVMMGLPTIFEVEETLLLTEVGKSLILSLFPPHDAS